MEFRTDLAEFAAGIAVVAALDPAAGIAAVVV